MVRQLAEFYPQFDDFLALLPQDSLAPGATVVDTLHNRENIGSRRVDLRRIIRSRVERDTIVDNEPAVVLSIRASLHIEVDGTGSNTQFNSTIVLDGDETGNAIVSRSGRLLHRTRTGDARGVTTYTGRGAQVAIRQTYSWRATIKALSGAE
jgi:hypothetical protein